MVFPLQFWTLASINRDQSDQHTYQSIPHFDVAASYSTECVGVGAFKISDIVVGDAKAQSVAIHASRER